MRKLVSFTTTAFAVSTLIVLGASMPRPVVQAEQVPPRPTLPVPERPPYVPEPEEPAKQLAAGPENVCLQLTQAGGDGDGSLPLRYLLTIRNTSTRASLRNAAITLPLPPAPHRVADVHTSAAALWASAIATDTLTLRLNSAAPGEVVTTTITILPDDLRVTPPLITQASLSLTVSGRRLTTRSNMVLVEEGWRVVKPVAPRLQLERGRAQQGWLVRGTDFHAYEAIGVWALISEEKNVSLTNIAADRDGNWSRGLPIEQLPANTVRVVAQGGCGSTTVSAEVSTP